MKELKDYLFLFQKHARLILGGALIIAVVTVALSYFLPPYYEASASLYVARKIEDEGEEYFTYEGFYAQQTAERYTETVVGLLTSEDVVRQALRKVGKSDDSKSVKNVLRKVKARRIAPQLVSLKVRWGSVGEAQDLWKALSGSTIEATTALNRAGDEQLSISPLETEPLVKDKKPLLWLNGLIGFLGGMVVFTAISSLVEYLK